MTNHDFEAFLKKKSFFGGKMGVELLGQPLSQKNVFENLDPETPL